MNKALRSVKHMMANPPRTPPTTAPVFIDFGGFEGGEECVGTDVVVWPDEKGFDDLTIDEESAIDDSGEAEEEVVDVAIEFGVANSLSVVKVAPQAIYANV